MNQKSQARSKSLFHFGLGRFLDIFTPSLLSPPLNTWQMSSSRLALGCDAEQDRAVASSCSALGGFGFKLLLSSSHWRTLQPPLTRTPGLLWGGVSGNGGTCTLQMAGGTGGVRDFCRSRWAEEGSGGRYQDLCASLRWHVPVRTLERALAKARS